MKKLYFDVPFGQIHGRQAGPSDSTAPPVFCFHQSPMSSWVFEPLLDSLGSDRLVYALDTPGFGASTPPEALPEIEDYADALGQALEAANHPSIDIVGYHTGALIATELALIQPDRVRRLVLIGLAIFEQPEIDAFESQPWPKPVAEDGSHLMTEWDRSVQWAGPGMDLSMIARSFAEKLHAGPNAWWGARAAFRYPMAEKLPQVEQPILALGPRDDLWEISQRAEPLIKNGHFERLPDQGFGLFETATAEITTLIRAHLDA